MVVVLVLIIVFGIIAVPIFKVRRKEFERTGKRQKGHYMSLGMGIGIAFGITLGSSFDNFGSGIAIGVALGAGIGVYLEKKHKKEIRSLTTKEIALQQKSILLGVVLLALAMVAGIAAYMLEQNPSATVSNFEECIAAGNPAMESYPRQCRHEDTTYTETIDVIE
mgnify:CR=1 FL=1